ncbi:unnamed protein product [Gordionus sp. m RMFG-2023]
MHFSVNNDYFNIDSIIATQEKTKCKLNYSIKPITGTGDTQDIAVGSYIDIPIWLSLILNDNKSKIIEMGLPKAYTNSTRLLLEADSLTINLNSLGPYFYLIAKKILFIDIFKSADHLNSMCESILKAFIVRFNKIILFSQSFGASDTYDKDLSINSGNDNKNGDYNSNVTVVNSSLNDPFLQKLDNFEEYLYQMGYNNSLAHSQWLKGDSNYKLITPMSHNKKIKFSY